MYTFYEFFAGGGMARAGLGKDWECLLANDNDPKKAAAYTANWGQTELICDDVAHLSDSQLPGVADLAWASFPCQDLSLAGSGAGLKGDRSGAFWPFWELMRLLKKGGRGPRVIVLENVCGALTSHAGKDFSAICMALKQAGYNFGAVVVNAVHFVPQSRPRLFIIAVQSSNATFKSMQAEGPITPWHTNSLVNAYENIPQTCQSSWIWWNLPMPSERHTVFADVIEENPQSVKWHSIEETKKLLGMMNNVHLAKVKEAQNAGTKIVGTIYKRTRQDQSGVRVQRAEVRFDDVAGCLRTPAGGSSRQVIIIVEGQSIRTRLLSSREAARLMGLPDSYQLPEKYNDAYHLIGDGVAVPAVRFLATNIIEELVASVTMCRRKIA